MKRFVLIISMVVFACISVYAEGDGERTNLFPVRLNGKWGLLDINGKYVVEPCYDEISEFDINGLAIVKINGKYGGIDSVGKYIIQPVYDDFSCIYIKGENGEFHLSHIYKVKISDKYGLVDKAGNVISHPQYDYVGDYDEKGWAEVEGNGKLGFIDTAGKIVISQQYNFVGDYDENGWAVVEENGKYGFIDTAGKIVISPQFDDYTIGYGNINSKEGGIFLDGYPFEKKSGMAAVEINGKWGFIDRTGKFVISPQFDGIALLECSSSANLLFDENGFAVIIINNKFGFIDMTGKIVISPQFDEVWGYRYCGSCDGNNEHEFVVGYPLFDKNGLSMVNINDRWGVINTEGKFVINPVYEKIYQKYDVYCVLMGDKFGILDKDGNWIAQPQFDKETFDEWHNEWLICR